MFSGNTDRVRVVAVCHEYYFSDTETEARVNKALSEAKARTRYCPKPVLLSMMQATLSLFPKPSTASAVDVWREMLKCYPEDDIAYLRIKKLLKEMFPPTGLKYRKNKGAPAFKCAPVTHRANAWAFIIR